MNDPHVEKLIYRLDHHEEIDYAKAPPFEHHEPGFLVHIDRDDVEIEFTDHYATAEDARAAVEPFLRAWELSAALQYGPGEFEFSYRRADVVDRNPIPGVFHAQAGLSATTGLDAKLHVGRARYPNPPCNIARDAAVDLMFERYRLYRDGRTTLPDAANFCLTVLLGVAGGRRKASKRFGIALPVLRTLGEVLAKKGGKEARKFDGALTGFTGTERASLEKWVQILIRRAAEVAFDPHAAEPQITKADLPLLEADGAPAGATDRRARLAPRPCSG